MAFAVVWQDPITGKTGYTALSTDTLPHCAAGSQAWITDQPGTIKQYDGTAWVQTHSGGVALVSDPAYTMVKYAGSGYTYLCEADIGTARSTASWRVTRITDATGDIVFAGTGAFEHAATDLATVAALTYTLGA